MSDILERVKSFPGVIIGGVDVLVSSETSYFSIISSRTEGVFGLIMKPTFLHIIGWPKTV